MKIHSHPLFQRLMKVCLTSLTLTLSVTANAADPPRIALVMKSLANPYFVTMAEGARAHSREHAAHYDLLITGIQNETDSAGQIRILEKLITEKVDAIVLAPADSGNLVPVVSKALEAGITVINIDNKKWEKDFTPLDDGIDCELSNYYSKAYLRHLIKAKEITGLTIASTHNLAFYLWLVKQARQHIIAGDFVSWKKEMVEVMKTRL